MVFEMTLKTFIGLVVLLVSALLAWRIYVSSQTAYDFNGCFQWATRNLEPVEGKIYPLQYCEEWRTQIVVFAILDGIVALIGIGLIVIKSKDPLGIRE